MEAGVTMTNPCIIHWFRQDLRLADNPALLMRQRMVRYCQSIFLMMIMPRPRMGAASRWWLHRSLNALNRALDGRLVVLAGDAAQLLPAMARDCGATMVTWNRAYEPWRIDRDSGIKSTLIEVGIAAESFNASLLWEPWEACRKMMARRIGFSPLYRRGCLKAVPPRQPLPLPSSLGLVTDLSLRRGRVLSMLLACCPALTGSMGWTTAGRLVRSQLKTGFRPFLMMDLLAIRMGGILPARRHVSRLSPYLHWGEISPNTVWYAVRDQMDSGVCPERDGDHFLSELGWREFSHSLLYHFPDLPRKNLQARFDHFDWRDDPTALARWQQGMTGYPIVDAAMRELWQTGYMHNRPRMIVGSFLVKNLRLHWHHGERWFWDCLVDADLANNSASWQWIAGCGADAAPYFRIFNPITQGEKFDPKGDYIRHYVPEIADLPDAFLCSPLTAPDAVLAAAGVRLGVTYPRPLVDAKASREAALAAFSALKAVK